MSLGFFEYLDRKGERCAERYLKALAARERRAGLRGPGWPDSRGWIVIASFLLTVIVLLLIWLVPELRRDEFFKNIAVLIVGTGWINGALSWAFSATKQGGELADANKELVRKQVEASPPIEEGKKDV
ncbi:hypothetical protein [Sphingomonas immobilis]|uniref:Uncharacterized protein n=1 Tax=Sphingomonas immobilis TaxID=3063997 RepID=A0ABT8ZU13_9SPHN|nr:hypothetical protein [Sphingomonas sp. CA1-15]MDO7841063.1 hypothetical protein [Sphingomonas sp. CA1-15]